MKEKSRLIGCKYWIYLCLEEHATYFEVLKVHGLSLELQRLNKSTDLAWICNWVLHLAGQQIYVSKLNCDGSISKVGRNTSTRSFRNCPQLAKQQTAHKVRDTRPTLMQHQAQCTSWSVQPRSIMVTFPLPLDHRTNWFASSFIEQLN